MLIQMATLPAHFLLRSVSKLSIVIKIRFINSPTIIGGAEFFTVRRFKMISAAGIKDNKYKAVAQRIICGDEML